MVGMLLDLRLLQHDEEIAPQQDIYRPSQRVLDEAHGFAAQHPAGSLLGALHAGGRGLALASAGTALPYLDGEGVQFLFFVNLERELFRNTALPYLGEGAKFFVFCSFRNGTI